MTTEMMALNIEDLEQVNGGFRLWAAIVSGVLGAGKGAALGVLFGSVSGPVGATAGAIIGGSYGCVTGAYVAGTMDER